MMSGVVGVVRSIVLYKTVKLMLSQTLMKTF